MNITQDKIDAHSAYLEAILDSLPEDDRMAILDGLMSDRIYDVIRYDGLRHIVSNLAALSLAVHHKTRSNSGHPYRF